MDARVYLYIISVSTIVITGCKKPYTPKIIASNTNYLVVEGVINTGQDSTFIKLSRTVNISAKTTSKPELNATVVIESDLNTAYPLQEKGNGVYAAPPLNLDSTRKYHLSIKTADNKTYQSDYVEVKATPVIDSILYQIQANGVQIYVNTHDNSNKTRYYRWDYTETWIFHTAFADTYKLVNGLPVYRLPSDPQVYQCWRRDSSSTVTLASTIRQSSDVVLQQPLTFVSSTSEKLERRYSILVQEYALTEAGFQYYENIKTNTEQLGGIFDAQPSSIKGNITCTSNPSEPVIGFISAGTISKKRIFIDNSQLPDWLAYTYYDQQGCIMDTVSVKGAINIGDYYGGNPPLYLPTYQPYLAAPATCVDCTLRGTNKQPSFWQ